MKRIMIFVLLAFLTGSCSKEAEPIAYGEDVCAFCGMTIVDGTHAAQLVTQKGKNYKFDASECMIQYMDQKGFEDDEMVKILSADYNDPGNLVDATKATFIITEGISSPMGANLTALKEKEDAEEIKDEKDGELYEWGSTLKQEVNAQSFFKPN